MSGSRIAGVGAMGGIALIAGLLGACATAAIDPVQETLDERDGTTITRLTQPMSFVTETVRGNGRDPFAFLAPFESNRMGQRRLHLWVAVPVEGNVEVTVAVRTDDTVLLEVAGTVEAAGSVRPPYSLTAPWQRQFVADLDARQFERLSQANKLVVEVRRADGQADRFASDKPTMAPLQEFRSRLGL